MRRNITLYKAHFLTLDRIEGDTAILMTESRETLRLPLAALPPGAREGDVLRRGGGGYLADKDETARRKKRNARLFAALQKPPEGLDAPHDSSRESTD